MENERYLECLAADAARLREVAGRDPAAPVPSCPEWTVADLVYHLAEVYLHKTETMRRGAWPRPWPPDLTGEDPLAALDRSYAALTAEFASRKPEESTLTWFAPDQTVGFWVRRMAQETVIHRVDAELALGESLAAIPDDLALDGVDEVLVRFLAYGSRQWTDEFGDHLEGCDGRGVLVTAGGSRWLVRLTPTGVDATHGGGAQAGSLGGGAGSLGGGAGSPGGGAGSSGREAVAASVSGEAADVLLWLWRRADDGAVGLDGDPTVIAKLRELLGDATQ